MRLGLIHSASLVAVRGQTFLEELIINGVSPRSCQHPMTPKISRKQRQYRLGVRHLLAENQDHSAPEIASALVALHSSDPASVYLSIAARLQNPDLEAVTKSLIADRTLVRHHAMRRTIWVMTPETARQAHASATLKIAASERRSLLMALQSHPKIDDPAAWLEKATKRIRKTLMGKGPLPAREIGRLHPSLALPIQFGSGKYTASLNAHTKVLQLGGFEATFVRTHAVGSWTSGEYAWANTSDWLDDLIAGYKSQHAAPKILHAYLERFGPATLTDIRWWFGWTAKLTKESLAAIEAETVALDDGVEGFIAAGDRQKVDKPPTWVRLLPGLDPTTMGWKERDWYLAADLVPMLFDQFGNAGPTIWSDGEVVGGWAQRPDASIIIKLFRRLTKTQRQRLDEAIAQLEGFLRDVVVRPRFPSPLQKELSK